MFTTEEKANMIASHLAYLKPALDEIGVTVEEFLRRSQIELEEMVREKTSRCLHGLDLRSLYLAHAAVGVYLMNLCLRQGGVTRDTVVSIDRNTVFGIMNIVIGFWPVLEAVECEYEESRDKKYVEDMLSTQLLREAASPKLDRMNGTAAERAAEEYNGMTLLDALCLFINIIAGLGLMLMRYLPSVKDSDGASAVSFHIRPREA